jgi:hypothetical protein
MAFTLLTYRATSTPYNLNFSYLDTDEDILAQNAQLQRRDQDRRLRRESRISASPSTTSSSSSDKNNKRRSFMSFLSNKSITATTNKNTNRRSFTSNYSTLSETSTSDPTRRRQSLSNRLSIGFFSAMDILAHQDGPAVSFYPATQRDVAFHGCPASSSSGASSVYSREGGSPH